MKLNLFTAIRQHRSRLRKVKTLQLIRRLNKWWFHTCPLQF